MVDNIASEAKVITDEARRQMARALRNYEQALQTLQAAEHAVTEARKTRDVTFAELKRRTERDSRILIGNKLVTCNHNGGITIEHVDLYGNVG